MKILITGSNGLLGQKIVDQLNIDPDDSLYRDHVIALLKKSSKRHIVKVVLEILSDAQKEFLKAIYYQLYPDVIPNNVQLSDPIYKICLSNKNYGLIKKDELTILYGNQKGKEIISWCKKYSYKVSS